MTFARMGKANQITTQDIRPPFSNFQFVDALLSDSGYSAVRRLFSLARRDTKGQTLVIEDIEPAGALIEENAELLALFPAYQCSGIKRLTFWSQSFSSPSDMVNLSDADLLGYAIIKQDTIPDRPPQWHIFESVFCKYSHHHNCIPGEPTFTLSCGDREYHVKGIMYCQQNGMNKACAQVALRSLLSRILPDRDITFSEINRVARQNHPRFYSWRGT